MSDWLEIEKWGSDSFENLYWSRSQRTFSTSLGVGPWKAAHFLVEIVLNPGDPTGVPARHTIYTLSYLFYTTSYINVVDIHLKKKILSIQLH